MSSRNETKAEAENRTAPSNGGGGGGLTDDNVGKIRDILFGEQMEGYDERFGLLEQRVSGEIQDLQKTMEKGFEQLRDLVEKRTESVADASVPRRQLADGLEKLAAQLRGK